MSKTINTLAALFVAAIAVPSAAEAGGVRLQFGGPLGSFVAHPHLSSGPGGTMRNRSYAESRSSYSAHCKQRELAKARKIEIARQAAHARKIELARAAEVRRDKIETAERTARKAKVVQTAKLEDKTVTSDAPVIFVPESPAPDAKFTGTQSTPAPARTAAVNTNEANTGTGVEAEDKTEVVVLPVVEENDTKAAETAEAKADEAKPEQKEAETTVAEKICRRFSAAIAGLITVPCN
ncbi:MAG: hypothetical protein JNL45_01425 [Hyphomicrobium sp.]|nr:hypothetical protein [Hyphomicrobium sp.]